MSDTATPAAKSRTTGAAAERLIFTFIAIFTAVGLISGVYYREFTKIKEFDTIGQFTQLATVHTHFLALGVLLGFIILIMVRVFDLARSNKLMPALWLWIVGVSMTGGMQVVKGSLQVAGNEAFENAAIAGISGLGHMVLTVGFIFLLMAVSRALSLDSREG